MLWILCNEEKWRSGVKPFETGGNVARFLAVRAARLGGHLILHCSQDPCCSRSNPRTALCLVALLMTRSGVCWGTLLGRVCPHSPAGQNLPWVGFELKLLHCGWIAHVQRSVSGSRELLILPEIQKFGAALLGLMWGYSCGKVWNGDMGIFSCENLRAWEEGNRNQINVGILKSWMLGFLIMKQFLK